MKVMNRKEMALQQYHHRHNEENEFGEQQERTDDCRQSFPHIFEDAKDQNNGNEWE